MPGPCFDTMPRLKFSQSLLLRAFLSLAFDDVEDMRRSSVEGNDVYATLLRRIWPLRGDALRRTVEFFGADMVPFYVRFFGKWYDELTVELNEGRTPRQIWLPDALDIFVHEYARGTTDDRDCVYERLFRKLANGWPRLLLDVMRVGSTDFLHTSIAACGAKGNPSVLTDVYERARSHDGESQRTALELAVQMSEETKRTREEFLDNFVRLSKSVPKCSYFCSSWKWSAQRTSIYAGDLWNGQRRILRDVKYYMERIRNKNRNF